MVTSVTLALALSFEPAELGIMERPPRPTGEPLITRLLFTRIVFVSLLMVAASFSVFNWELARGNSIEVARTAVVNMLVMSEVFYLFNVRRFTAPAWGAGGLLGNPIALWTCAATLALQALFTYAPPMQALFGTAPLDAASWGLIVALAFGKFVIVEGEKAVLRGLGVRRM